MRVLLDDGVVEKQLQNVGLETGPALVRPVLDRLNQTSATVIAFRLALVVPDVAIVLDAV